MMACSLQRGTMLFQRHGCHGGLGGLLFPGHTYGNCAQCSGVKPLYCWCSSFQGPRSKQTGSLECRLKMPLQNSAVKLAKGTSRSLPNLSPPMPCTPCVCNSSVSLIHVDLKSWESQHICGTQPVNTQFKESWAREPWSVGIRPCVLTLDMSRVSLPVHSVADWWPFLCCWIPCDSHELLMSLVRHFIIVYIALGTFILQQLL